MNHTQQVLSRLGIADREYQKQAGARFLLGAVKYACLIVLAAFLLDVVFHLRSGWRLALLLAMIGGALTLAAAAWYLAFVRRNRLEHIARFLETRDPALGSRLINLLQLRDLTEDASLAPLTRDLARQAVDGYAGDLTNVPLEKLARTDALRRQFRRTAWALLGFALVLAAFFRVTAVEVARFADPFGDHPPYSFTRLEIVQPGPEGTNVLYGKGIVIRAKAYGHQPKEVFLTACPPDHPDQALTLPMFDKGKVGFDQLLDNIHGELLVFAHTKDQVSRSKQVHIGVVLTPQLERSFVKTTPPAYTGLKPEEKVYSFKGIQVLAGTEVRFRLQSNRPLREGLLEVTSGDLPPRRIKLEKSAENEVSGSFAAADSGRLRFSIVDASGLPSEGDWEGALTVTHDLPPQVQISNPEHDAFVAMDFKLQVTVDASDDYGLHTVRLHRSLNGVYSAPRVISYETGVLTSHETEDLDLAHLGIRPGDVISLFAEAVDTAPQPHLARSKTVRLLVISVEDYNNFMREQTDVADAEARYAELNADLQQLIENQKQLGEAAQKLSDRLARADTSQQEALTRDLDNLLAQQTELNEKLNQQAERMDSFVREHPLYDVERDLQELLRQQAENIRQSTRTNSAASRDIARRSEPANGPRQLSPDMLADFKQESDDQVARLGGVREASEKQVVQKLEDMSRMQELIKDFNQFESLYRTQEELAAQSQAYNRPGQLSREDQLALKELAATEKQVGDLLQQLTAKLRDDAQAAKQLFPKAAQSGCDLADKMEDLRLRPLAEQATGRMLAGDGQQSFQLADRLRGQMAKLFTECQSGNCPSSNELDSYLTLQRLKPGRNFAQMAQSRKFGTASGQQAGMGMGEGSAGTSGYAVVDGSTLDVLGNEAAPRSSQASARQSSHRAKGAGAMAINTTGAMEKPDVVKGLNPVNRQSGAVASEAVIDEYHDVVESYFKAITTRKPSHEK